MTEYHEKTITEYKDADFNRRLHMYLQFPHLRSKFISIDQNDLNSDLPVGFKLYQNSLTAQLNLVLSSALGYVKRCCGIQAA